MILTGTIVNSAAIVAGSIAGLLLGKFIPERFSDAMEKGAALCVLYIGVDGMLAGENTLVAILRSRSARSSANFYSSMNTCISSATGSNENLAEKARKPRFPMDLSPPRSSSVWARWPSWAHSTPV